MDNCSNKSYMTPRKSYVVGWQSWVLLLMLLVLGCRALSEAPLLTPTPRPTMTPIPGWEKFEGTGIEIWLPEHFVGGNISENLDLISEQIKSLGPEYEPYLQQILQNPSMFSLWAYDSELGSSRYLTNIGITTDKVSSLVPIDTYTDESVSQLPDTFHLLERDRVTLNGRDARRLVVEMKLPGISAKALMYILVDGNTVWLITYTTASDEFDSRLPVFEQSANTFNIKQ
jgi:hypothetical protein